MATSTRRTELEIVAKGGQQVAAELDRVARAAERMATQARAAGTPTSAALRAVDQASREVRQSFEAFAGGPMLNVLRVLGPGGLLVAGAAAAGVALGAMAKRAIDNASALQDASAKIGLTVERYQELSFAARQVGVDEGALTAGLAKFNANVGAAALGTGALASTLGKLDKGMLAAVQSAGSTDDALGLVLQKIAETPRAADKAALAVAAFGGKSGAALVPVANNFETLRARANELGLVLSGSLGRGGDDAGDRLAELGDVVRTNLTRAVLGFAPAVAASAKGLADLTAAASVMIGLTDQLDRDPRLADVEERISNARKLVTDGGGGRGMSPQQKAAAQERFDALLRERKAILDTIKAEEDKAATERKVAAEAAAATAEQVEAEKEGEQAAKAHASARKSALAEIARYEEQAATAGLEGIEKLAVERDRELAHIEELAKQHLLTEEETARGRLAIEKDFQEKAADAAEKEAEKVAKALEKENAALAKPFVDAFEHVQQAWGDALVQMAEDGKFTFDGLADAIKSSFIRLAAEVAQIALVRGVVVPLLGAVLGRGGSTAGGAGGSGSGGFDVGGLAQSLGFSALQSGGTAALQGQGLSGIGKAVLQGIFGQQLGPQLASALFSGGGTALGASLGGGSVLGLVPIGGAGVVGAVPVGTGTVLAPAAGSLFAPSGVGAGTVLAPSGGSAASGAGLAASAAYAGYAAAIVAAVVNTIAFAERKNVDVNRNKSEFFGTIFTPAFLRGIVRLAKGGNATQGALEIADPLGSTIAASLSQVFRLNLFGENPPTRSEAFREAAALGLTRLGGGPAFSAGAADNPYGGLSTRAGRRAVGQANARETYLLGLLDPAIVRWLDQAGTGIEAKPSDLERTHNLVLNWLGRVAEGGGDAGEALDRLVRRFVGFHEALRAAGDNIADVVRALDVWERRLPRSVDLRYLASVTREREGYFTPRTLRRTAFDIVRADAEADLALPDFGIRVLGDHSVDELGRARGRRATRWRRGITRGANVVDDAVEALGRGQRRLELGGAETVRQVFGEVAVAIERLNTIPRTALGKLPALLDQVTQGIDAWGSAIRGVIDQVRALDQQMEDFRLSLGDEVDALRQADTTALRYNDVLAANAARYERLVASGGSAAAQLTVVDRQLALIRRQAQAQAQDVADRLNAQQRRTDKRLQEISPLAGLATGVGDQILGIQLGALAPTTRLARLRQLQAEQLHAFRTTTGADQATAAGKLSGYVGSTLGLGGALLGPASGAYRTLESQALRDLAEVQAAAEAAAKEQAQLLADLKTAQEAAQDELEAINQATAAELELWGTRALPLFESQHAELLRFLGTIFPAGTDLQRLIDDPLQAQLAVMGLQQDLLGKIHTSLETIARRLARALPEDGGAEDGRTARAAGRGDVTVAVTVEAPPSIPTAMAELYGRTHGTQVGAQIAAHLRKSLRRVA